ncbi:GNAT family N-acetyltransferase [Persicimonas caeni]|uniref:GNAT family N-acetyltransferase n=1 Tax=Persicimonas caeni TaxID=2292766 RepID=A0A4Y6PYN5_PERCE|nr:GNAT family N-acetyltransferase [Persicimonas caeni]QDG53117.1 GNAT family N-acetyltransferase [Persicimonas caeni]QED34339.1 GNAT family N-acetyltransferase [Persicimonas caeni]
MVRPDDLHLERLAPEQVQPLRTKILRPHFDEGELCEFVQDHHHDTAHYGIVDRDFDVHAVVTYIHKECPHKPGVEALQLRGMCVDEPMQRRGLGERLLEGSLGQLAVRFPSVKIVWCNARTSAVEFYEKMGFEKIGEVFEVDRIGPHVVMWKTLPVALA